MTRLQRGLVLAVLSERGAQRKVQVGVDAHPRRVQLLHKSNAILVCARPAAQAERSGEGA